MEQNQSQLADRICRHIDQAADRVCAQLERADDRQRRVEDEKRSARMQWVFIVLTIMAGAVLGISLTTFLTK
ncbi:hypothetical protein GM658_09050 [Pseudoduganella eburnea]|uniref:Uncharacterized protein n=1 Tax=Massilia eburnea TaxID=1776165 RepID=A0A6L6QF61_9BURK|nr:hypothetical protein [Massilia eburnea]MTW10750.1 hypothetical protein [Massilia eburnea]